MKNETEKKSLTDWDWTTLVAAWRYYEHGHTIASAMFPHEIVRRFFTGSYDEESCRRIARQFVEIDHRDADTGEYFCARLGGWVEKCPNFPDGYPWDAEKEISQDNDEDEN